MKSLLRTSLCLVGFVGLASCAGILDITGGKPDGSDTPAGSCLAADGGPLAEACTSEGARRCSGTLQQECTTTASGCRAWSAPAECAADSICCDGSGEVACVPVSASNCYACGATCSQPNPECLSGPKKCGCNAVACSAFSQACDVATGACADCQEPGADVTEIFVDVQAPPFPIAKPRGSQVCPFYSITAALAWARSHPAVTTIRVAAGTYASGETFPLDLRGLALIGAGSGKTIVRGQGVFNRSTLQGQLGFADMRATLIAGHPTLTTRIEGLTMERPTALTALEDTDAGLLCDQGNILERTPATVPAANTIVRDLVVAKGFARSVVVSNTTATTAASGCNLKITASELQGGPGNAIAAWGAWRAGTTVSQGSRGVAVEIGGADAADAVLARGYRNDTHSASSFYIGPIAHVRVTRLTIDASDHGLILEQEATPGAHPIAEIRQLTVTNGNQVGLWLNCDTRLSVLEDSNLSGVNRARVPGSNRGWGLVLSLSDAEYCKLGSPTVVRGRRNRIVGNDWGIVVTSSGGTAPTKYTAPLDFGTAADPGGNVIRCNSLADAAAPGHDLQIDKPRDGVFSFYGNEWDHVKDGKPTIQASATPSTLPDGVDGALDSETNMLLTGSSASSEACPAGKIAGPAPL
jgi:hypothetical protein